MRDKRPPLRVIESHLQMTHPHLACRRLPVPDPSLLLGSCFLQPGAPHAEAMGQAEDLPCDPFRILLPQNSTKGVVSLFEEQLSHLFLKEGLLGREVTGKDSNPSWATSCFETQGLTRREGRVGEGWGRQLPVPHCTGCQTPEVSMTASVLLSLLRA